MRICKLLFGGHSVCRLFQPVMVRNSRLIRIAGGLVCLAWCSVASFGQLDNQRPPSQSQQNDRTATGSIRGRVVMANGSFANNSIKVTLLNIRDIVSIVYTDNQGQFELRSLNPGNYRSEERRVGKECRSWWSRDQ